MYRDSMIAGSKRLLTQLVDITRCQAQRFRLENPDFVATEKSMGYIGNDIHIVSEIGFSEVDQFSYFVPECGKSIVKARMKPGSAARMILQENDILLSFQGTGENVGKFAFVSRKPLPTIPLNNLCIIRPRKVDPVWLFYRLSKWDIYQNLRKAAYQRNNIRAGYQAAREQVISYSTLEEMERLQKELQKEKQGWKPSKNVRYTNKSEQEEAIRQEMQAMKEGRKIQPEPRIKKNLFRLLAIPMDDLRFLQIKMPTDAEVESAYRQHKEVKKQYEIIQEAKEQISALRNGSIKIADKKEDSA